MSCAVEIGSRLVFVGRKRELVGCRRSFLGRKRGLSRCSMSWLASAVERNGSAATREGARLKLNGLGLEGKDCTSAAIVYTNARFANALHQKKHATGTIVHSPITCIIHSHGVVAAS